jgi:hypothetical protein
MKIKITSLLVFFTILFFQPSIAQQSVTSKNEVSLLFGLNQPIFLKGFNVEINYYLKNFVFDYSHGFGLQYTGDLVSDEAKAQRLNFNVSHSVGIGIGYRFTKRFNLRVEPKLHIWEVYYNDQSKSSNAMIAKYNTYTLGLGAYYRWQPFEKSGNILKGFTVAPSVRWWPNVGSSLENNQLNYANTRTGKNEIHHANNIGLANTAFFFNVSVGYTFGNK